MDSKRTLFRRYCGGRGKTAKSIMVSCGARLAPFDIAELKELTFDDEMELDRIGRERAAL